MSKLLHVSCFCLLIFLSPTVLRAQTFGAWQIGSTAEDVGNDIVTDTSGNMYVVGAFQNTANFNVFFGTTNETSNGGSDMFLAKYSRYGILQWINTMGGRGDDEIKRVVLDATGNIYLCGSFSDTVDFDASGAVANGISQGGKDIFFAKYDNDGNFQWVKTIGTINDDVAYGIALDHAGNICIDGGYGLGSADFDPGNGTDIHTNTSASAGDNIFFAKYDNNGNYIWAKTLNGCCDDVFTIATDTANNVFIGGRYQDCLNWDPLGSAGGNVCAVGAGDAALAKYDKNGSFIWVKSFGSASNEEQVSDIKIGASGNVFFTGYFGGNCNADPTGGLGPLTFTAGPGTRDIFIAKYENGGNFIWAKGIASPGNGWANALGIDPGDNIYIGGAFQGLVDFNPGVGVDTMRATVGNHNAFTATYDSTGAYVKSTSSYGGNSESKGGTVYASKGYTAGYFQGTDSLGKYSFTSKGDSDIFFAVGCLQPIIASFSPTSGPVGTVVTISGSNFDPIPSFNIVHFGSVQAIVTAGSLYSLTVIVPAGALYNPISVENECGLVGYSTQQYDLTFSCSDSISIASLKLSDTLTCASPGFPYNVDALDMDGDGKPDLLVTNNGNGAAGNISAFRNTGLPGNISFAAPVTISTGSSPTGICSADIDGDGKKDIIVANEVSGTVVVYLNTSTPGNISFASALSFTCPSASSVAVADLDGDGRPDIICGNNGNSNSVIVMRNNSIIGVLAFDNPKSVSAGGFPLGVCARDIDGDHLPDIITTNSNTNQISVIRNKSTFGKLSFSAPFLVTVGDLSKSTNFDVGDLDGDGKADVAFGSAATGSVGVLRNTSTPGLISFAALVSLPVSGNPSGVRISDINGDGLPDLVACYPASAFITVFQNKSTSGVLTFTGTTFSMPGGSQNIAAEDFDGDGKNDLVVPYFNGSTIYTFRNMMNGGVTPVAGSNSPVCSGSTLNLNGSGGAVYLWTGPNNFASSSQNPSLNNISSVYSGIYSLTVTNAGGCKASISFNVVINPSPTPFITVNGATSFCQGGFVTLDAASYTSYSWSTGQTTETIIPSILGTNNYTVVVTANGCNGTATKTITIYTLPTPVITANGPTSFCQGGSVILDAGQYSSYSWNTGDISRTISVTAQGTYSVVVTDANGCTALASKAVTVYSSPTPIITANGSTSFCQGGSVTLDAGSYSLYSWNTAATTETINPAIIGVNTYSVTVTDLHGCTGTASKTVIIYFPPTPVITANGATSFCRGGSVTLDAGLYSTYKWNTGPSTRTINASSSGTYVVTVTDGNSCTATASKTVVVNPLPTPVINTSSTTISCNGGSVTLSVSSYSSYKWSTNATTQSISVSTAGNYSVTVTDTNGCTGSASKTITLSAPPNATASNNSPVCNGGTVNFTSSGGVSYSWIGPNGFTSASQNPSISNVSILAAGTYTVMVTAANGCNSTATTSITFEAGTPTCAICDGSVVTVSENVTINFNTNPPTYSGDPSLKPFFDYDISGRTRDQWNAIFDVGKSQLLVKSGVTITTVSTGGYAPGITLWSKCGLEIDSGAHVIVNSTNQNAGSILIQIIGNININGEVRDEVTGTGLTGCITVATKCGDMSVGQSGLIADIGTDQNTCGITLVACGDGIIKCNGNNRGNGNITVSGLVKTVAHAHGLNQSLSQVHAGNIKVVATSGAVTINASSVSPLYSGFQEGASLYDIYGGLLSWVDDNVPSGEIDVQSDGDVTVSGHGINPNPPVRTSFGAIAAISTGSSAPGGFVDVRSKQGGIIATDRSFDVSGKNLLSVNNAHIRLYARENITLSRLGANNNFNPVVDASSPNAGDKGGTNELRSFSGGIILETNALVSAAVPSGSGSVQGTNLLTSCQGISNNGVITPADLITHDNSGACSPALPAELYNSCEELGASFNFNGQLHKKDDERMMFAPNPTHASGTMTFTAASSVEYDITMFDMTGRQVMSKTITALEGENIYDIDMTGFSTGMYMLVIQSTADAAETREYQKIIIE